MGRLLVETLSLLGRHRSPDRPLPGAEGERQPLLGALDPERQLLDRRLHRRRPGRAQQRLEALVGREGAVRAHDPGVAQVGRPVRREQRVHRAPQRVLRPERGQPQAPARRQQVEPAAGHGARFGQEEQHQRGGHHVVRRTGQVGMGGVALEHLSGGHERPRVPDHGRAEVQRRHRSVGRDRVGQQRGHGAAAAPQVQRSLAARGRHELDEPPGDGVEEADPGLVVVVGDVVEERLRSGWERGQPGEVHPSSVHPRTPGGRPAVARRIPPAARGNRHVLVTCASAPRPRVSAHGHQGRARAPHDVHVRPAGDARAPHGPAAAGRAQPHAGRGLLAAGEPGEPLRQLAAGPVRQPPRPAGVPRGHRPARDRRRPGGRPRGGEPLRLLRRGVRRAGAVRLRPGARHRPGALPAPALRDPRAPRAAAARQARGPRRPGRGRRAGPGEHRRPRRGGLLDPHGARRHEPGGDAGAGHRVVP